MLPLAKLKAWQASAKQREQCEQEVVEEYGKRWGAAALEKVEVERNSKVVVVWEGTPLGRAFDEVVQRWRKRRRAREKNQQSATAVLMALRAKGSRRLEAGAHFKKQQRQLRGTG
ncbi:hypothetical protein ACK3TF_005073 [Chlorella vulgaris]